MRCCLGQDIAQDPRSMCRGDVSQAGDVRIQILDTAHQGGGSRAQRLEVSPSPDRAAADAHDVPTAYRESSRQSALSNVPKRLIAGALPTSSRTIGGYCADVGSVMLYSVRDPLTSACSARMDAARLGHSCCHSLSEARRRPHRRVKTVLCQLPLVPDRAPVRVV